MTHSSTDFRFDDKMNFDFHAPRRVRVETESALYAAEQHEFIRLVAQEPVVYRFKHVLIQDAAYSTLTRQERRRLHGITASVLETGHSDDLEQVSAELAQHYSAAGDDVKTVEFAALAAETNRSSFAVPEARLHYAKALEALERLPASVENRRRKIDLWLRYLDLRWAGGTAEQDLVLLNELEQLARTMLTEQDNAKEDRLRLARIHHSQAGLHFALNRMQLAMQAFRQVLDEAQDLGDEQLLATPSLEIGGARILQGFFAQGLPLVARAWAVYKDQPVRWQWASLAFTVTALANLGRFDEARQQLDVALARTDVPDNSRAMTFVNHSLMTLAWVERSPEAMLDAARRAVQSSRANSELLDLYIGLAYQALAESYLGLADAAHAHMQESRALRERMGGQVFYSDWAGALYAETVLRLGDPKRAVQLAREAYNFASSTDGWYAQGLAQRIWADALLALEPENPARILEHLNAALIAFETCEAVVMAQRTRETLAKLTRQA